MNPWKTVWIVLVGSLVWPALSSAQVGIDCATTQDVGYVEGVSYDICLIKLGGEPIAYEAGCAFYQMAQAAFADGIVLEVSSGFRTNDLQQYFYDCMISGACNNGNPAADPGYSKHQSGLAIDVKLHDLCPKYTPVSVCLEKSDIFAWLHANANDFGFEMTFTPECWHWVYQGGGPAGCPCEGCEPGCNGTKIIDLSLIHI